MKVHDDALEVFNHMGGWLQVGMNMPPARIGNLLNERAQAGSKLLSTKMMEMQIEDEVRNSVVIVAPSIKVTSLSDRVVEHLAPNGKHFTVQDLILMIEQHEFMTRGETKWFGGADIHHVYFEGMDLQEDGVWELMWGS